MAALHFGNLKTEGRELPKTIHGIPTEDILKMMDQKRKEIGDELFGRCLGIMLEVSMNPEVVPAAEKMIDHFKQTNNESKDK